MSKFVYTGSHNIYRSNIQHCSKQPTNRQDIPQKDREQIESLILANKEIHIKNRIEILYLYLKKQSLLLQKEIHIWLEV